MPNITLQTMNNKNRQYYRAIAGLFSLAYLFVLTYLVFFARRRRSIHERSLSLHPFRTLIKDYRAIPHHSAFKYYTDATGNIMLFVPLPFVMAFVFRLRNPLLLIAIGIMISCQIELLQYIFIVGYSDIDDVILNTAGTCIGILLYNSIEKKHSQQ
jgi:glycopeptide antibiotics resistance protein